MTWHSLVGRVSIQSLRLKNVTAQVAPERPSIRRRTRYDRVDCAAHRDLHACRNGLCRRRVLSEGTRWAGKGYTQVPQGAYSVVAEVRAKPGKESELRADTLP